jgi:hypothetical protein
LSRSIAVPMVDSRYAPAAGASSLRFDLFWHFVFRRFRKSEVGFTTSSLRALAIAMTCSAAARARGLLPASSVSELAFGVHMRTNLSKSSKSSRTAVVMAAFMTVIAPAMWVATALS